MGDEGWAKGVNKIERNQTGAAYKQGAKAYIGEGNNGQQEAAQEQSPQPPVYEQDAADPMAEGYKVLVAAGYQIMSREPLVIYIPPGLTAQDVSHPWTPERGKIIEETIQKVQEEEKAGIRHAVHPGWAYAFRWGYEYAERKRQEAKAVEEGQET